MRWSGAAAGDDVAMGQLEATATQAETVTETAGLAKEQGGMAKGWLAMEYSDRAKQRLEMAWQWGS